MSPQERVEIGELSVREHEAWLVLRERLWPEDPKEDLVSGMDVILDDPRRNAVFVARLHGSGGELVGFVEAALRDWAEGCRTRPVGYIEGWYVAPEHRRSGVGRALVTAAEVWAHGLGCRESGSDAVADNVPSARARTTRSASRKWW